MFSYSSGSLKEIQEKNLSVLTKHIIEIKSIFKLGDERCISASSGLCDRVAGIHGDAALVVAVACHPDVTSFSKLSSPAGWKTKK